MKHKKELTASEILDFEDDGRVLLLNREDFLLGQFREDKQRSLVKRRKLMDKTKRDLRKAKKENSATVPELEQLLAKLKAEQKAELRFETTKKPK